MLPEKQQSKDVTSRKRAVVYCRVSTDKQEQNGESLEYQEEKCRRYADLHDIDVLMVLKEAKSGFIHYSHREQLTLARQFLRDRMADVIIVWDLRRFSRNFVHSAMIFEEIESIGAEIVSISENIDNSLTGKLIRSILAWSAESEREKILEYANRHWQTRMEHGLPVATGRAPYGWDWKDTEKTRYVINKEEAAVRVSIFEMFVELDMSIRGIAHKLTEDGILPPAKSRGAKVKSTAWQPSTVFDMLTDGSNIGILTICKTTTIMSTKGTVARKPNDKMKTIPGGIPAIITVDIYERAQLKLKNNKVNKSNEHKNPEDFLLKGHVICKTCNYRMYGRNQRSRNNFVYPYYCCCKFRNKYDACPDLTTIRTVKVNQMVWEDCCRVFERLELIRDTIERNIEQSLQNMLENTKGKQLILELEEEIAYAKQERTKHPGGSYYYKLISQDIKEKEEQLQRYEEEYTKSRDIVRLSGVYQKSIMDFLNFLNTMKGKYHEASFKEKRNALDVLGVKVYIHPDTQETPTILPVETEKEWLSIPEVSELTSINQTSFFYHIQRGDLKAYRRNLPMTVVHRDELARYLKIKRPHVSIDQYEDEWFSINRMIVLKLVNYRPIHRAIRLGEIETHTKDVPHPCIHRDELNRFLRESPIRPKSLSENIEPRIEITYTPIFTGVQSAFG